MNIPTKLPNRVKKACHAFTPAEFKQLEAFVSPKTGHLFGIGYNVEGQMVKPNDPKKLAALEILEENYRQDLQTLFSTWVEIENRMNTVVEDFFEQQNPAPSQTPLPKG